jgi:serine/threonine-protein kinase
VAYAILTGQPPFAGPNREDFCVQHLTAVPPQLRASPRLQQVAAGWLSKAPELRGTIATAQAALRSLQTLGQSTPSELSRVGADIARAQEEERAQEARRQERIRRQTAIASEGKRQLSELFARLTAEVKAEAPVAIVDDSLGTVQLGSARLFLGRPYDMGEAPETYELPLRPIAGALISIEQKRSKYPGRSANLWLLDYAADSHYRWWEISYMIMPHHVNAARPDQPFGIDAGFPWEFLRDAHGRAMTSVQAAARPVPIDREHEREFLDRWKARLAAAAAGSLERPSRLPE